MNALFAAIGGWLVGRGLSQRRAARARRPSRTDIAQRRAAYLDDQRRRAA